MKLNRIWHCPRPELAARYLALLTAGPVASTTIFAPRRTGKTAFLREDLTPAALAKGFIVAYVDLWQTRVNPGLALIRGLEEALEGGTFVERAATILRRPVKKVSAKGALADIEGGVEVEFDDGKKASAEMAFRLDDLVSQLVRRKPLLLLVDEAQELARSRANELTATALRTSMTKHRDVMRVVFTGSSRTKLAHVFSNTGAPLYSVGSTVQEFPLLGRELVEFVAQKFEQATQRKFDIERGWAEFQTFKHQPEPFLTAVVAVLMQPDLTLEEACRLEREELALKENHEGTWAALDGLQRALVTLFAEDALAKPFSKLVRARLSRTLGLPELDAATIQYSLRKLAAANVVVKSPRGNFVFESEAFERWVRTLAPEQGEP